MNSLEIDSFWTLESLPVRVCYHRTEGARSFRAFPKVLGRSKLRAWGAMSTRLKWIVCMLDVIIR